jgi:hypothetical protein
VAGLVTDDFAHDDHGFVVSGGISGRRDEHTRGQNGDGENCICFHVGFASLGHGEIRLKENQAIRVP